MLSTSPPSRPKDWVRAAFYDHCSFVVKDAIIGDSDPIVVYSAHGIVWSRVFQTVRKNCDDNVHDHIKSLFLKSDGRDNSKIMLMVYGLIRRAANVKGYAQFYDGVQFVTVIAPESNIRVRMKREPLTVKKYGG